MQVTNNGNIINSIGPISPSVVYKDFIAFQDADGAIFHIRASEVQKLWNAILKAQQPPQQVPQSSVQQMRQNTQKNLDDYFTEPN